MNLLLLLSLVLTAEGRTILFCPNGDADRTAEVVRALRGVGSGDRIVFEQGIYHFHPEAAEQLWLYPSNNTGGRKQVVFALRGLKNIVVDGRGSTFVFYGRTFPFAFLHCQNVKVKNLTVTTRYPWAVNFDVKEKDDKGFRVRLGRETDYRIDSRGNISFFLGGDSLQSKTGRISLHALDGFCVNYLMTPDASAGAAASVTSWAITRCASVTTVILIPKVACCLTAWGSLWCSIWPRNVFLLPCSLTVARVWKSVNWR